MAAKEMRQAMMEKLGTREYRIRLTEDPEGGLCGIDPGAARVPDLWRNPGGSAGPDGRCKTVLVGSSAGSERPG